MTESMPTALITGAHGQSGSYLCELLLSKGYEVHFILRRNGIPEPEDSTKRINHIFHKMHAHRGDILDPCCLFRIVEDVWPDEVYHLAAQSHVMDSFKQPSYSVESIVMGTLNMLEACRQKQAIRFYQASSSEMFGGSPAPQDELTPFTPRSPYACAKLAAHNLAANYRESYGMHISCGLLFNHESERRGATFVTRKITRAAARIKLGLQSELVLGNLDAKRDWGYASDYVKAMWLMLQQDQPDDYVIATGETHSVKEFLKAVFGHPKIGLDWQKYVRQDQRYFRPTEVNCLQGDASKAKRVLGWEPTVTFKGLVDMMVEHDLAEAKQEWALVQRGYKQRVEV